MIIELSGIDCFVNQLLKYLIGGGTLAICIAVSNFIYLTFIKGTYKCYYHQLPKLFRLSPYLRASVYSLIYLFS